MATTTKGNCCLCGAEISKSAMKAHILKKHSSEGQERALFKVEGGYKKGSWLYIDVPLDETLEAVDQFLRDIWLECCHHMSIFRMKDEYWDEDDDYGKAFAIGSIPVGTHFENQPTATLLIRKVATDSTNAPLADVSFKAIDSSGANIGPDDGIFTTDILRC